MPLALSLTSSSFFHINDREVIRVSHIGCAHTVLAGVVQSLLKGTVIKKLWQQDLARFLSATSNMWKPWNVAPQALVRGTTGMILAWEQ